MRQILFLSSLIFSCTILSAQDSYFVLRTNEAFQMDQLDAVLTHYSEVTSNTQELYSYLKDGGRKIIITSGNREFRISDFIEKTNISPNYILRIGRGKDKNGNPIIEEHRGNIFGIKNFIGRTEDGGRFRMTMNKFGYLTVTIREQNGVEWNIHPIRNFDLDMDGYILFKQSDYKAISESYSCGVQPLVDGGRIGEGGISTRGTRDWYEQEMAIASDSAMWARKGSVGAVNAHNSDITMSCEPEWSDPDLNDSLTTIIIEEYVSTTHADDPWVYRDVIIPGDALAEFRDWGGFTTNPDTKKGVSGNVWENNTVGVAWYAGSGIPTTCGYSNQFMIKDLDLNSQNRNVEDHERGHNMGCPHVTGNFIMRSSIGNPGFTDWKQESIDRLDMSIPDCPCFDFVMPITLISFDGSVLNNDIILYWDVSNEINNDYFEIEKQNERGVFESLGTIPSLWNDAAAIMSYSFVDRNPFFGKNIYRLKQTDLNGDFTYSSVINVGFFGQVNKEELTLSPNPVSDILQVEISGNDQEWNVEILTLNGQKTHYFNSTASSTGNISIDVSDLAKGVYFIYLQSGSNQMNKMFIKN